jgi:hypothetical protein
VTSSGPLGSGRAERHRSVDGLDRRPLPIEPAVVLIVVSTPSLTFSQHVVGAHETVRVQARGSELAIERFEERIVGSLATEMPRLPPFSQVGVNV